MSTLFVRLLCFLYRQVSSCPILYDKRVVHVKIRAHWQCSSRLHLQRISPPIVAARDRLATGYFATITTRSTSSLGAGASSGRLASMFMSIGSAGHLAEEPTFVPRRHPDVRSSPRSTAGNVYVVASAVNSGGNLQRIRRHNRSTSTTATSSAASSEDCLITVHYPFNDNKKTLACGGCFLHRLQVR